MYGNSYVMACNHHPISWFWRAHVCVTVIHEVHQLISCQKASKKPSLTHLPTSGVTFEGPAETEQEKRQNTKKKCNKSWTTAADQRATVKTEWSSRHAETSRSRWAWRWHSERRAGSLSGTGQPGVSGTRMVAQAFGNRRSRNCWLPRGPWPSPLSWKYRCEAELNASRAKESVREEMKDRHLNKLMNSTEREAEENLSTEREAGNRKEKCWS